MDGHSTAELGDVLTDRWNDSLRETKARSFFEAIVQLGDGTNFATQAKFADGEGSLSQGFVFMCRDDRQSNGQVDRRLSYFYSADDVDEYIIGSQSEAGAFFEDGDDHSDAVSADAGDFSPGSADD